MPYQFVHTSAIHLLDTQSSGYGTVARSEALPRAICNKLSALSVFREPAKQTATIGPQFSYHIIDHAGETWHVLTCTQQAGADYSGRACHISHHLVLTRKEVEKLLENELRPTPAGITLALLKSGFWLNSWKGEPRYIDAEPQLNPRDLPDASNQTVWKQFSGHKSNARAFFTPPYHRECLVTLPICAPSHLVLSLFHESDWLTPSRGWGMTYTTEAGLQDQFSETLRMVCTNDSPLVQKAERTGHPVLHVSMDMELPMPPAPAAAAASQEKDASPGMMRVISRSEAHYHYTEEPDWLLYDVRQPVSRRQVACTAALVGAGIMGIAIGCGLFSAPQPQITPILAIAPGNESEAPEITDRQDELAMLKALLAAPYDHEATQKLLIALAATAENCPEDTLLLECAALTRNAQQIRTNHAATIKRLCECARLLQISDTELVHLYLREATHNLDPAQWQEQWSAENLADWIELKQSEPQILAVLQHPDFQPYQADTSPAPDATILATAEQSQTDNEPCADEPEKTPGRVSLVPRPVVSGQTLPSELEDIIPNLPCTVDTGVYVLSGFEAGDSLQAPRKLELSPDGFRLYISQGDKAGVFTITPEHIKGTPSPLPPVHFEVKGGRLRNVTSNGSTAVVSFPVPTKDEFHTNILLVPTFALPIPERKGIKLPPASKAGLNLTPDDLEIIPPTTQNPAARLKLKRKKAFPWVLGHEERETIRFTMQLPVLTGHNSVQETGSLRTRYEWKGSQVTRETEELTTVRCSLELASKLPERLGQVFNTVLNETCCGEEKMKDETMCLAQLYYIICALSNERLQSGDAKRLHQAYFRLFAHKRFNKVLMRVFEHDPILQLPPQVASQHRIEHAYKRSHIKQLLGERNFRNLIRQRICEVLSRSLYAAYTQEQKALESEAKKKPLFVLKDIDVGNHVELLWKFRIEYADLKS